MLKNFNNFKNHNLNSFKQQVKKTIRSVSVRKAPNIVFFILWIFCMMLMLMMMREALDFRILYVQIRTYYMSIKIFFIFILLLCLLLLFFVFYFFAVNANIKSFFVFSLLVTVALDSCLFHFTSFFSIAYLTLIAHKFWNVFVFSRCAFRKLNKKALFRNIWKYLILRKHSRILVFLVHVPPKKKTK